MENRSRSTKKSSRYLYQKIRLVFWATMLVIVAFIASVTFGFLWGTTYEPKNSKGKMVTSENFGVFVTTDVNEYMECLELIGFSGYPIIDIDVTSTTRWGKEVTKFVVTYEMFAGFNFDDTTNIPLEEEPPALPLGESFFLHIKFIQQLQIWLNF